MNKLNQTTPLAERVAKIQARAHDFFVLTILWLVCAVVAGLIAFAVGVQGGPWDFWPALGFLLASFACYFMTQLLHLRANTEK